MSIRAKLLLSVSLLVAVAFVVTGFVTVTATRARMIDRVDSTLVTSGEKYHPPRDGAHPRDQIGGLTPSSYSGPSKREIAVITLGPTGTIISADPSGYIDDPDPLPDLSSPGTMKPGEFYSTGSADGSSLRYRVLVVGQGNAGQVEILAAPLDDVDDTIRQLMIVIGITGMTVLVVLVGVAWFIIRRGLEPVDHMAGTATLIAGGDLTRRVDYEDPNTEVGQLGLAFNSMLAQIESAFADKERSEQRLRQFVADASHELRTPITSIRGYAELYRSGAAASPDEIGRAMSRIESEGARMGRLVEDLLLLARLDQGRPIRNDAVDLVGIVTDAVHDARAAEPDRPISYEHPDQAIVTGDKDKLQQAIMNLLANVRVHTDVDTPVRIAILSSAAEITVVVSDEGPGIDPANLDRLFDRFYRVDSSRTRANGGTGLGLSIVASVIDAHGGSVSVDSSPGEGSTFTIRLPLHIPDTSPELAEQATVEQPGIDIVSNPARSKA